MQLPKITHLQFLVLGILFGRPAFGCDVRDRLAEFGVKKSGPGFYQMMSRLEDSGFVTGSYEQQIIDGQRINQRRYEITTTGQSAWRASREFYEESIRQLDEGLGHARA